MRRFLALAASTLLSTRVEAAVPPVLPNELSTVIGSFKPIISSLAATALPATLGSCVAGNPPAPCQEIGNLFAVKTSYYNITARWVSGLNTVKINQLNLSVGANGSMHLDASVSFTKLPVSLYVDGCVPEIGCKTFIDNSNTCCGGPITVNLGLDAACSETYPFVQNLALTKASIGGSLEIMVSLFGKQVSVYDATSKVQEGILTGLNGLFQDPKNMAMINMYVKKLYGDKIFCTKEHQAAFLASSPPRRMLLDINSS